MLHRAILERAHVKGSCSQRTTSTAMAAVPPKEQKELTKEEIDDYREAFNNFDRDGNGEINQDELCIIMKSLGYNPTQKQLEDMMRKVDTDGNGSIGFDEFVAMMRKCEVETDFDQEVRQAFKFFDTDGSGTIDKPELEAIMKKLGANLSEAEIDLLLREADTDNNGHIDIEEFLKIMYQ